MFPREKPLAWLDCGRLGVHVEWDGVISGCWIGYVRVFARAAGQPWEFDEAGGQPWLEPVFACVWHFDGSLVTLKLVMNAPTPRTVAAMMAMARTLGARAYTRERWDLEARTKRCLVREL